MIADTPAGVTPLAPGDERTSGASVRLPSNMHGYSELARANREPVPRISRPRLAPWRRAVFALGTLAAMSSCAPDEVSLLLEIRSDESVDSLQVFVVPLGESGTATRTQTRRIDRSAADLASGEPIRVVITFSEPRRVLVHIEGLSPEGAKLVATRCYEMNAVVRDPAVPGCQNRRARSRRRWFSGQSNRPLPATRRERLPRHRRDDLPHRGRRRL